jgi:hypothetical protein
MGTRDGSFSGGGEGRVLAAVGGEEFIPQADADRRESGWVPPPLVIIPPLLAVCLVVVAAWK